ncbi:I78 family peptidase inhibitor [Jannaschia sp. KMU-145]|uniref:I78 family peptidase inhibitor n=1 Tax=Jannaschia halovivens TaxID=3388667 RepID=UPI00396B3844
MRWMAMALVLLAGCRDESDTCGLDRFEGLIGRNIDSAAIGAHVDHRVIGPDTAVTMDYLAERLNVRVDADGVITGLDCG